MTPGDSVLSQPRLLEPGPDDRHGGDRRQRQLAVAVERRSGRDRRQTGPFSLPPNARTGTSPMTAEVLDFLQAIDQYKRANRRPFPTWSEVLEVLKALGYRKTEQPPASDRPTSGSAAPTPPRDPRGAAKGGGVAEGSGACPRGTP